MKTILDDCKVDRVKDWQDGSFSVTVKETWTKKDGTEGASWIDVAGWKGSRPEEGDRYRIEGNSKAPRAWVGKDGTAKAQNQIWAHVCVPLDRAEPTVDAITDDDLSDSEIPF